jgi:hypothetical protein
MNNHIKKPLLHLFISFINENLASLQNSQLNEKTDLTFDIGKKP